MIQSKEAVTPEMINAVNALRIHARGGYMSGRDAIKAFELLDSEGFFDLVDEAAGRPLPTEEEVVAGRERQEWHERWLSTPK